MCLTADQGVGSSIPARSHAFVEIDHQIISTVILPSADSRRVVFSYKQKYGHEVLVTRLVKLAQEIVFVMAVDWEVKHQTKGTVLLSTQNIYV